MRVDRFGNADLLGNRAEKLAGVETADIDVIKPVRIKERRNDGGTEPKRQRNGRSRKIQVTIAHHGVSQHDHRTVTLQFDHAEVEARRDRHLGDVGLGKGGNGLDGERAISWRERSRYGPESKMASSSASAAARTTDEDRQIDPTIGARRCRVLGRKGASQGAAACSGSIGTVGSEKECPRGRRGRPSAQPETTGIRVR